MTEQQQLQKNQPDVGKMLNDPQFQAQLKAALPRHMTPERMARIAMTEIRKNQDLLRCDPVSFIGAVIQCAQLGLEPGNGLGHAYLIPYWDSKRRCKVVNMIPGYKGLIDLARRSGQIQTISARVVRAKDHFKYAYGLNESLEHVEAKGDRGEITHVYAVARLKDGGSQFEVMTVDDVNAIKERSGNKNPVWTTDFAEMARKTAVRRIVKYLPMSPELATTLQLDNQAFEGEAQDNYTLVDVNYEPRAVLSEDATTVAEISAQEAEEAESKTAAELQRELLQKVADLAKAKQATPNQIWKFLGFDSTPVIVDFPSPRIVAMIDALKTFRG